jgi:signal transduction histidine kinase
MKFIKISTLFFLLFIIFVYCNYNKQENKNVKLIKVGIYDNPPKIEMPENKKPAGIFIDILQYIAQKENWELTFIKGTWDQCLNRLKNDSIDLMPDVAYSEKRAESFDFNKISVLSSWIQVYCRKNDAINTIKDLNNKKIAVLSGSIQMTTLEYLIKELNIFNCELIYVSNYFELEKYLTSNKADVAVLSRFYAYSRKKPINIVPTPIILNTTSLHFATKKGKNNDLLDIIDKHLSQLQIDIHSVYYSSLEYWLNEKPKVVVPKIILFCILILFISILFFILISLILKWQVNKKTQELKQNNEKLKKTLEELKTAQEQATSREKLYAFGQLANGLAHDFNNFLTPIINLSNYMIEKLENDKNDNKEFKKNLELITKAAKQGADIVKRLQDFYRNLTLTSQKNDIININECLLDVIEIIKLRWKSNKQRVELILNLGNNIPQIKARRAGINEVFMNLLLNASDALGNEGKIEVTTIKNNNHILIEIKDNGCGMPKDVLNKCLQPFFTTKQDKGTGMGLTISSSIINEHNGKMQIISEQNVGTKIIISLPINI